jgi:hypothetical protein
MNRGFLRALRGELYAMLHRRSLRLGLVLVVLGVVLQTAWTSLTVGVAAAAGGGAAQANFWPRFAQAAGFGLGVAELATVILVGAMLPREIGLGAARDPLVRGISRTAFVAARALMALLCPFVLGGAAVLAAAGASAALYDAGHVVSAPFLLEEDPELQAGFAAWQEESGVRADEVSAWLYLVEEEGLEEDAARERLGLPAFEFPDDYYGQLPILVFLEEEVAQGVLDGLVRAVLPLAALGLFAFLVSLALPTGSLASGLALVLVVLFSVFLAPEMPDTAARVFADWLPGLGPDSALALARHVADGYTDVMPPDPARVAAGVRATALSIALFFAGSLLLFPRRKL